MHYLRRLLLAGVLSAACVAAQDAPKTAPEPAKAAQRTPRVTWEYKVFLHLSSDYWGDELDRLEKGKDEGQTELNKLGDQGWELVGVTGYKDRVRYALKRAK